MQLILGDCLEVLQGIPAGSVDAVVTDPPYGYGTYKTDHKVTPKDYLGLIQLSSCAVIMGYPEDLIRLCVKMAVAPDQWMTWYPLNKPNNVSKRFPLVQVQESIALFGTWNERAVIRRERTETGRRIAKKIGHAADIETTKAHDVFQDSAPGTMFNSHLRQHPNEKPVSLMRKLIELATVGGATVLDPFMGSGTTGVACVQTGRNFIGIEIDPTYYAIAKRRIELAQQQLPLGIVA